MTKMPIVLRSGLMAFAAAAVVAAPAVASEPPTLFALRMNAALQAQSSVRTVATGYGAPVPIRLVTDAGPDSGTQRITYGTGHVTVLVVPGAAYVRGDEQVLVRYMGYKPGPAARFSNVWIRIPVSDRDYGAVSSEVTMSSVANDLTLSPPINALPSKAIGGRRLAVIQGTLFGRPLGATTYASPASHLPVRVVTRKGSERVAVVVLSNWGEAVHVTAPANSTPIAATGLE